MSEVKKLLQKRKKELLEQLKPYRALQNELDEVEKALAALEPPTCSPCCSGCDICRRGPLYR